MGCNVWYLASDLKSEHGRTIPSHFTVIPKAPHGDSSFTRFHPYVSRSCLDQKIHSCLHLGRKSAHNIETYSYIILQILWTMDVFAYSD